MKALLTPKELADAIGVSESSLRRWVDSGQIDMSRTAGGHRRIPLAEAIRFIRAIGANVVRPELLGLVDIPSPAAPDLAGVSQNEKLFSALLAGERKVARGLILSWYLQGQSPQAMFDGPIADAMHRVGEVWKHEARGILIEHRATEICLEVIAEMRRLLPAPQETAPLAIGGGPQNDPYILPTMMAGAVLAFVGFRDVNFGANTPVELLLDEAIRRQARLVWLSMSAPQDPKPLRTGILNLANGLAEHNIQLVLGGRNHAECAPRALPNVSLIGSMSELAAFARGILSGNADAAQK